MTSEDAHFCDTPDNNSPGALACREWKYPLRDCVVCRIIFRTIFFTWAPDCIKKIAYLLYGSVLAWRSTTQGPWDYWARIRRNEWSQSMCTRSTVWYTGLSGLCSIFLEEPRRESARLAKMIFYYVSTWIEVLRESVKFLYCVVISWLIPVRISSRQLNIFKFDIN